MDDDLFDALRGQIDHDIDADRTGKMGIAMGFGLAGEFFAARDVNKGPFHRAV